SANRSGRVSPTTPQHVLEGLAGRIPMVVAGGRTEVGLESTILDLTRPRPVLLRPGGVTIETLTGLLGQVDLARPIVAAGGGDRPTAPGQLESHYAPGAPVRIEAAAPRPGEAYLAFGPELRGERPGAAATLNLSPKGDLLEAAANLFAMLRALDRPGI